jgi:hypothetical protein
MPLTCTRQTDCRRMAVGRCGAGGRSIASADLAVGTPAGEPDFKARCACVRVG